MGWSYTGDPGARDLDMVRFLLGDTDSTDPQLTDEEINAMLTVHVTAQRAAAGCANVLVAKYTRMVDKSIGDLSISYSQRAKAFKELAAQLKADSPVVPEPFSAAMVAADKDANESDTSLVQPFFRRGMHDINSLEGTE